MNKVSQLTRLANLGSTFTHGIIRVLCNHYQPNAYRHAYNQYTSQVDYKTFTGIYVFNGQYFMANCVVEKLTLSCAEISYLIKAY